jgi:hypothetical protein
VPFRSPVAHHLFFRYLGHLTSISDESLPHANAHSFLGHVISFRRTAPAREHNGKHDSAQHNNFSRQSTFAFFITLHTIIIHRYTPQYPLHLQYAHYRERHQYSQHSLRVYSGS